MLQKNNMDLQKKITEKEQEINKIVAEINQLQTILNDKGQEALRLEGALKQLQELLVEDKK